MLFIIYLLLMLKDGCCKDFPIIQGKTVNVGDPEKLECPRRSAGNIYWMRFNFENAPEIINRDKIHDHIKVYTEPGELILRLLKAQIIDSGIYICVRDYEGSKTYMSLIYLIVKEPAATSVPTSAPSHLHYSVTLYCSALQSSQNKSCPEDESLLCLRAESIQSLPDLNYTDSDQKDRFRFNSEGCLYSYSKNSSLSGAQMYHCAVMKNDKEKSGGKSNLNTSEIKRDSSSNYVVICLLIAALAICLVVIACLIYLTIKLNKKLNSFGKESATVCLQANESINADQENQKSHEDLLLYSAVSTRRKASRKRTAGTASVEQDVIYTEVNILGL